MLCLKTIHAPIFPLQNLQRPILTDLLAKIAITYNRTANLYSWYFEASVGAVHSSRDIARGLYEMLWETN